MTTLAAPGPQGGAGWECCRAKRGAFRTEAWINRTSMQEARAHSWLFEGELCNSDKLQKWLDAQLHAGSMPDKACRRLSIAKRACKLVDARAKLKQKAARITGACQELRAGQGRHERAMNVPRRPHHTEILRTVQN